MVGRVNLKKSLKLLHRFGRHKEHGEEPMLIKRRPSPITLLYSNLTHLNRTPFLTTPPHHYWKLKQGTFSATCQAVLTALHGPSTWKPFLIFSFRPPSQIYVLASVRFLPFSNYCWVLSLRFPGWMDDLHF
jgi:hypothetical protein